MARRSHPSRPTPGVKTTGRWEETHAPTASLDGGQLLSPGCDGLENGPCAQTERGAMPGGARFAVKTPPAALGPPGVFAAPKRNARRQGKPRQEKWAAGGWRLVKFLSPRPSRRLATLGVQQPLAGPRGFARMAGWGRG